ncbi:MAG: glutamyl-tRNA reductase [Parachlamydiaceae bacterium]|nr:glutamyl-tRNA reductase [Parachlamydiaceae bacterium]
MRVGVVGINHKLADLNLRELLAQACQRCFMTGSSTQDEHTFVLLTTCNRTEVYFTSHELAATHSYLLQILRQEVEDEFDQKVYSYFGYDCFLHLARVTAGLDSAIVAETEIQGQVKTAYEKAVNCISLPGELHYLFQKALKIGKQVRTDLPLGRGMPDLEHAVYQAGKHFFKMSKQAKILFVGASDINCKILAFLKSKSLNNITICNRSAPRSHAIAAKYETQILEWQHLADWYYYDWIIFGTKAPHHLISPSNLPNHFLNQKLLIDLSVPRNVDPQLGRNPRLTLLNIDQINRILRVRKQQMSHMLVLAEDIVECNARQYVDLFCNKQRVLPPQKGRGPS